MSTGYSTNAGSPARVKKRIIVCCDGTWEDGVTITNRQSYTNILRLARTINHEDNRAQPAIPQIVFYQSGIGSDKNWYSEYVVGITGDSLGDKVEEAYAFIAHNYYPGDEIFLFGFSRGAYTARMTAMFIGEIGVLDRPDMDHFAGIFLAYQQLGKSKDPAEIQRLNAQLAHWTGHDSPGKKRADSNDHSFSVKFVGVFDTVGSLGLPEEITHKSPAARNIFGFNDKHLGEHIEYAYHAMAINETREDFNVCKFEQTPGGRAKGQTLSQCWFTGSHADIGGGWKEHDLADLTLFWMASKLENHLSLDYSYLGTLPHPTAYKWAMQPPHDPIKGIYDIAHKIHRTLPTSSDTITHETFHHSVRVQQQEQSPGADASKTPEQLARLPDLPKNSPVVPQLLPLEAALREHWEDLRDHFSTLAAAGHDPSAPVSRTVDQVAKAATTTDTGLTTEAGKRVREKTWLGHIVHNIHTSIQEKLDNLS
jgi:uncharacterized protein (DUF2235 family)